VTFFSSWAASARWRLNANRGNNDMAKLPIFFRDQRCVK
jgi:hypothetical protein